MLTDARKLAATHRDLRRPPQRQDIRRRGFRFGKERDLLPAPGRHDRIRVSLISLMERQKNSSIARLSG